MPIVFVQFEYSLSDFREEYAEWKDRIADNGSDEIGPFHLNVAPDDYHKADVSGGAPYSIKLGAIDAFVEDEWYQTTFVPYLRECFRWGGFPGVSRSAWQPTQLLRYLTQDLIPF